MLVFYIKGTVGVNAALSAGTIGREGEAMMTTAKEGVLAFCSSKGLYGGVSLEFAGKLNRPRLHCSQTIL